MTAPQTGSAPAATTPTTDPATVPASGPAALRPETRNPGGVRANRTVLTLIGLVLTAAGGLAIAAALRAFGHRFSDQPVLNRATTDYPEGRPWFWVVVGVAGVVLALLCLWWLLAQARSNRLGELHLVKDPARGNTDLDASAVTDALTAEVERWRGVSRASAHLSGTSANPRLSLTVALDGRVDPGEVHARLVDTAVAHTRQAIGHDELPARIELTLPRRVRRDVR